MKRVWAVLLAVVMLLGLLAGCNNGGGGTSATPPPAENIKTGGTLVVGVPGDPQSFNPDMNSDDYGLGMYNNIFNCLVSMDADMNIIPDLAHSWDFSDDNTEVTFHLEQNVRWHDGEPFTSRDVKWTFDTILSEKGVASGNLSVIQEITCPDDYTVVMKLAEPDASLLGFIAWYGTFIMPAHIYEGTDWTTNEANWQPVGTGPFKFVSYQSGVSVVLEANEDYWSEGPYLDQVIYQIIPDAETEYQAFLNGEIDILGNLLAGTEYDRFLNDDAYTTRHNPAANRTYFTFNFEEGPFTDVRMRQAFNLALDREEIYTKGLKGKGALAEYYISPLYSWALNEDAKIPARNLEEARKLIEDCGYTADANGVYLTVTIDVFSGFEDTLVVAQANLLEAGIDLKINTIEYAAWVDKVKTNGDFEVTMLAGYQGPDIGAIRHRVHTEGGNNIGHYYNARVDELIELGASVFTEEERAPYYKELQAIMAEEVPMVFCNENGGLYVVRAEIKGWPYMDDSVRNIIRSSNYSRVWFDN